MAAAIAPGAYLSAFLMLIGAWHLCDLPTPEQTYRLVLEFFRRYGLVAVFAAAFMEGVVLLGLYFPGSVVILLAVTTSRGDPLRAGATVAVVTMAFVLTAGFNYLVGYFGFHGLIERAGGARMLARARRRYERHGVAILAPSFIHPNLGGFMSVAAGVARLSPGRFLAIAGLSTIGWNCVWGYAVYSMARFVDTVASSPWLVVLALGGWTVLAFVWGALNEPDTDDGGLARRS